MIKSILNTILTILAVLVSLFMVTGTTILWMEFGLVKDTILFFILTIVLCIPCFMYLRKRIKNIMFN